MARVALLGGEDPLTELLRARLAECSATLDCFVWDRAEAPSPAWLSERQVDTVVYAGSSRASRGLPRPSDAGAAFAACRDAGVHAVILLSSAAVFVPSHKHPGRVPETYASPRTLADPLAAAWAAVEETAEESLAPSAAVLSILRPATVLLAGIDDYFNRLLTSRWAVTLAGHDPTMQFLAAEDLADAVCRAVGRSPGGVFHLAPVAAIPWRKALRVAKVRRLPLPRWMHRAIRSVAAPLGLAAPMHTVDRTRYSWTIAGGRAQSELQFSAAATSAAAVSRLQRDAGTPDGPKESGSFDEFGLDTDRIDAWRRGHIKFLHDVYWRVELDGLHNLPRSGAAVLVGIHRGLMPFDGVMALHSVVGETGRYPRFLIHPTLVKFPFLANYMFKLGGVIACRDNAIHVLDNGGLLAVYPEGIRGAFTLYRDAYRINGFGRPDYVRLALRHGVPIVPFVTVGSAEIFPIFKKIDWPWWKRFTEWPCFPLTPTFPLLPVPLPSKWHTQYLSPIPIPDLYPPDTADDRVTVDRIDREVQEKLATRMEELVAARPAILYGSVFEREGEHAN